MRIGSRHTLAVKKRISTKIKLLWKHGKLSKAGCFKKGHTPWNVGVYCRLSPETEFQRGQHSPNFAGYGTIKKYYRSNRNTIEVLTTIPAKIKIPDGSVRGYHYSRHRTSMARFVWMKKHGKIKKKLIVYHKDGNAENNKLNNLILITRAELLEINLRRTGKWNLKNSNIKEY